MARKRIGVGSNLIGAVTKPQYPAGVQPYTPQPQQQTAPPPDPYFMAQQNMDIRANALGNAWDTYSLGQIENQFGYGADVSNPFAEAKLLEDQYNMNQRGAVNSQYNAGSGSGAAQDRANYNARQYAIQSDASRRRYQGAKDSITRGAMERYSGSLGNISQEDLDALIRALGR